MLPHRRPMPVALWARKGRAIVACREFLRDRRQSKYPCSSWVGQQGFLYQIHTAITLSSDKMSASSWGPRDEAWSCQQIHISAILAIVATAQTTLRQFRLVHPSIHPGPGTKQL